ncbi:MAG TPA: Lrp/AsnC family transcriptional regulator [Kiritimatiellia bacterium]|jgi:DNA-binding Lrp family transcriptional regulator|nr:Lrp/AsnC family transcriptional regulator [Kiritimatiellia bacterium]OQC55854.1 MAG: Leucine-responsive regulatory protein [Verrucomicrobia bacterium ADurb.Bin018]MBP9573049.1 Lrp/AsnC family transcriptional regulator [Kiritimatiellia bacterium]HOD99733.1 Lrp/AsnC family transcriptional regulator [Kiritimatiellia bacterium]HOE36732.1 Lrp/AsnC family transcriptional regulator [Kiritimatiellia bacterium]
MDELLTILQENARTSLEDIARMLRSTPEAVAARIAEYEKNGTIRGYRALVNEDLLQQDNVTAVIEVRVQPEREGGFDRIARRISGFPEVVNMYLMSGKYDLLLFVEGKNLREVASFVSERLSTLDGVLSTGTHFMLKTYKQDGVLMDGDKVDERLQISP